jgi:AP-4 complex subunit mu-1
LDGSQYIYIKQHGMYFCLVTLNNVSPNAAVELLLRIAQITKDYCGTLTEEAIRKNFVLIYELLDEMLEFGYPQNTSTEYLKSFVFDEPAPTAPAQSATATVTNLVQRAVGRSNKTVASSAASKSVLSDGKATTANGQKNEIFVDLLERLTVLFSSNGSLLRADVEGVIKMKSFILGNPEIKLGLNEDLVVKDAGSTLGPRFGSVRLDDILFHSSVRTDEWDLDRTLALTPPDGEFNLMSYRLDATAGGQGADMPMPFRVFTFVDMPDPTLLDITIKVRAEFPSNVATSHLEVRCPIPASAVSGSCVVEDRQMPAKCELKVGERFAVWDLKRLPGGHEITLTAKLVLESNRDVSAASIKKEVGPVSLRFDIPMFSTSNLQIRYLRLASGSGAMPFRWVRTITQSDSYVVRT